MALRKIRTSEDPILRKKSRSIEVVDDKVRQLLDDMAETMYNSPNGGGLAACQVGVLKRAVVIDMGHGLIKLINPEIVESEGEHLVIEGCLSFPNVWGKVKRPVSVVVKALNENGEEIVLRETNDMAKCLCHEIDHLNGIVFTDRVIEFVDL